MGLKCLSILIVWCKRLDNTTRALTMGFVSALMGLCMRILFHFTARGNFLQEGSNRQCAVIVFGTQNHAFAHQAVLELAWSQVGDEQYLFAYQFFWLVVLGNTADDGTVFQAVGNLELQELLHLRHGFAFQYLAHTDIQLLEVFETDYLIT